MNEINSYWIKIKNSMEPNVDPYQSGNKNLIIVLRPIYTATPFKLTSIPNPKLKEQSNKQKKKKKNSTPLLATFQIRIGLPQNLPPVFSMNNMIFIIPDCSFFRALAKFLISKKFSFE